MTDLPAKSSWLTIEGVALIVLGALAIIFPFFTGVAVGVFLGWVLIMVGLIGLVSAFAGRGHVHMGWSIASGVIALLAGLLMLLHPLIAAVALTLIVAAYLLFDGVTLIGLALDHRKRGVARWGWAAASGVFDLVLAVLILLFSGAGSAVFIGFIVGIDLIIAGFSLLALHRSAVTPPAA